eukprot:GHVU01056465.1.p1 GENE.GHVU01056465.1~~GHVU01056465.1.p1  ORF type:complete len:306 (-),score=41.16 GHVU01056465.1:530-1447(-)
MKITNTYNLPEFLMRVSKKKRYSRGNADESATGLIRPPRIARLSALHYKDMEKDISDEIWSMLGTSFHELAAFGADKNYLPEERLFMDREGWTISGAIDLQKVGKTPDGRIQVIIKDYKMTTIYGWQKEKPEWAQQQNIYAELVRKCKGWEVVGIDIIGLLRDWRKSEVERTEGYPPAPIQELPLDVWTSEECLEYIDERIRTHQDSMARVDFGEELPHCSDEERWSQPSKWAVMKNENKRATKVFETAEAAETGLKFYEEKAKKGDTFFIEHRPGTFSRCVGDWCGVAQWCDQLQSEKKEDKDE